MTDEKKYTKDDFTLGMLMCFYHAKIIETAIKVLDQKELDKLKARILKSDNLEDEDRRHIEISFDNKFEYDPVKEFYFFLDYLLEKVPIIFDRNDSDDEE